MDSSIETPVVNPVSHPTGLTHHPDDRLPVLQSALLGLQHALAMDVYVVPFIIASLLGLPPGQAAILIAAGFLAAGLATLIQSQLCLRMPLVQGPSYVPIGAVVAIAGASGGGMTGLGTVFGALIPGAVLVTLVGWPARAFHRVVERLIPPLVGGAIIVVVGVTLMPIGIRGDILGTHDPARLGGDIMMAVLTAALSVAASIAGIRSGPRGGWLRTGSVLVALAGGSLLAWMMGRLDFTAVAAAPWFARPHLVGLDFSLHFAPAAMLTMLLVYGVVLAETTGTWFAVAAVTGQVIERRQIDRGAVGEGLGCLGAALLGSLPVTGYASNAGIISLTGIASRSVFAATGLVLIGFGLCGKLAALIAAIPAPVIGGLFSVLCVVILMNGLRVLQGIHMDERDMMVAGLPILFGLFACLLPPDFLRTLPDVAQYLLGSPTAFGASGAILLNLILPKTRQGVRHG